LSKTIPTGPRRYLAMIIPQALALALGLVASAVFMILIGINPISVFSSVFVGAFAANTHSSISYLLTLTASFTLTALAFLIPGKAGIWNVGAQGQIYLGGVTAALIAIFVPLPPVVWPLVAVTAGCLAAAFWALIPGILEAYRNASAIVTTIMMNYIAAPLSLYVLYEVIVIKQPGVVNSGFATFSQKAALPSLPYYSTSIMVVVAVIVAFATQYFLLRTTMGYGIRAAGLGPAPAEAKGINPRKMKVIAMLIGGAVAGLAGVGDVLGPYHACLNTACFAQGFPEGWFGGEGFAGIPVALVALSNPIGAIVSAVFFGVLVVGGSQITGSAGSSSAEVYAVYAMQGIIILFMSMPALSKMLNQAAGRSQRFRSLFAWTGKFGRRT